MMEYRILNEKHELIPCDLLEWASFFGDTEKRRVALDHINGLEISTIFLGLDHGFRGCHLWFETMVFNPELDDLYCDRYSSWDEAVKGHAKACELVRSGEFKAPQEGEKE